MGDIKVSLDDSQLSALRDALKHPPEHFWQSDNLLRLAQVFTLVIGGAWVLTQFLWYQRDEIELKQKELSQSVRLKELEFELDKIKRDREAYEFSSLTASRFDVAPSLQAKMLRRIGNGLSLYEVTYSISLENNSGEKFESSLWVLEYFIGTVKEEDEKSISMKPIGMPASRIFPAIKQEGAAKWRSAGSYASVFSEAVKDVESLFKDYVIPSNDSALTGVVRPKEKLHFGQIYLVQAPAGSYVAFISNFCVDRCKDVGTYQEARYLKLPG